MNKYAVIIEAGYDAPEVYGPFDAKVDAVTFAYDYEDRFSNDNTAADVIELLPPESLVVDEED